MKNQQTNEHARVDIGAAVQRTLRGYLFHGCVGLLRHEPDHTEDDKAAVETGQTVCQATDHSVPATDISLHYSVT